MKFTEYSTLKINGIKFTVRAGKFFTGVEIYHPWIIPEELMEVAKTLGDMYWGGGYSKDFESLDALEKGLEGKEVEDTTNKVLQDYLNAKNVKEEEK